MNRLLSVIVALVSLMECAAQTPLNLSPRYSSYRYLYKISNDDVKRIRQRVFIRETDFRSLQPVDSVEFPHEINWEKQPYGNYLLTWVEDLSFRYSVKVVSPAFVRVQHCNGQNALVIYDRSGAKIKDAEVRIAKDIVPYDDSLQLYPLPRIGKKQEVSVAYSNTLQIIVPADYRPQYRHFTLPYIPNPFDLVHDLFTRETNAYILTNKPGYRPGDTVKVKMLYYTGKGKPIFRQLTMEVHESWYRAHILYRQKLNATHNGSYLAEFVLSDSFRLDRTYMITLYDGKKHIRTNSFRYEDYLLDEASYKASLDKKAYTTDDAVTFTLEGRTASGQPMMDGICSLSILPKDLHGFYRSPLHISDTLYRETVLLDYPRKTVLMLGDTLWPQADIGYEAHLGFTNSNNERHDTVIPFSYNNDPLHVRFKEDNDTIRIGSLPRQGVLKTYDQSKTLIDSAVVILPYHTRISPMAYYYAFKAAGKEYMHSITVRNPVRPYVQRTTDSVFVTMDNPLKLEVFYILSANHKMIRKGHVRELELALKDHSKRSYQLSISYLWMNEQRTDQVEDVVSDKALDLALEGPMNIMPGQQVKHKVKARSASGEPLRNVNLSVSSATSQFKSGNYPGLSYLGKYHNKGRFPDHQRLHVNNESLSSFSLLTDDKRMRFVDTFAFYDFLLNDSSFVLRYDSAGVSEFSPHIFQGYSEAIIHLIYLDEQLVYVNRSDADGNYSFPATPGHHTIRIRLAASELTFDSVLIRPGQKLEFIYRLKPKQAHPSYVHEIKMPEHFTQKELRDLSLCMMVRKQNSSSGNKIYIHDGNRAWKIVRGHYKQEHMIGPLVPFRKYTVMVENESRHEFVFEPGYVYTFKEGEIIKEQYESRHLSSYNMRFVYNTPLRLGELSLTYKDIPGYDIYSRSVFGSELPQQFYGTGHLYITHREPVELMGMKLCRLSSQESCAFLEASCLAIRNLAPGQWVISSYYSPSRLRRDTVFVSSSGRTCLIIDGSSTMPADTTGREWEYASSVNYDTLYTDQLFGGSKSAKGRITDAVSKLPVGFATVELILGGSVIKTIQADEQGYYEISRIRPGNYRIRASTKGYAQAYIEVSLNDLYNTVRDIALQPSSARYPEVIVHRTYPTFTRHVRSGIDSRSGYPPKIRGARADGTAYYIDGIRVQNTAYATIPQNAMVMSAVTIQRRSTRPVYSPRFAVEPDEGRAGLQAFAQVVRNQEEPLTERDPADMKSSVRSRFSDYAVWQPDLITDKNGEADFTVTYPDNITTWNTHIYAVGRKRFSGQLRTFVTATKPVTAQLNLPRFLISGDTFTVFGKASNYSGREIQATHLFISDSITLSSYDTLLGNFFNARQQLVAPTGKDTMHIAFETRLSESYTDGELESIPVLAKGLNVSEGRFYVANRDTVFFYVPADSAPVSIRIMHNSLDVLRDEIRRVESYPYNCNEQMASKLIALICDKLICRKLNEPFGKEMQVRQLVRKLENNINNDGEWGWWEKSRHGQEWITSHVITALQFASANGYQVKESLLRVSYDLGPGLSPGAQVSRMYRMAVSGTLFNYTGKISELEKQRLSFYSRVQLLWVKKQQDSSTNIDWLLSRQKRTWSGAIYWSDESGHQVYGNSRAITLLAFGILKRDQAHRHLLPLLEQYLMENRGNHGWMNTYESSLALIDLVPYITSQDRSYQTPDVSVIRHNDTLRIAQFPYFTKQLLPGPLRLAVKNASHVYIGVWQDRHLLNPPQKRGDYAIDTRFNTNANHLKAGETATFYAEVSLKQKSDYVMIEIPVPAGCVYGDNTQVAGAYETHREYHKDKVIIFCNSLEAGQHTFTVKLQARYDGTYTLNPAKVSLMYFPVFNGNNEVRQVRIRQ